MIQGTRRFDLMYHGDPEYQPLRSFESPHLVRLLHRFATYLNGRVSIHPFHSFSFTLKVDFHSLKSVGWWWVEIIRWVGKLTSGYFCRVFASTVTLYCYRWISEMWLVLFKFKIYEIVYFSPPRISAEILIAARCFDVIEVVSFRLPAFFSRNESQSQEKNLMCR